MPFPPRSETALNERNAALVSELECIKKQLADVTAAETTARTEVTELAEVSASASVKMRHRGVDHNCRALGKSQILTQ
jgi:hypothetical protein